DGSRWSVAGDLSNRPPTTDLQSFLMYQLAPELHGPETRAERQQRFRVTQQQVAAVLEQRIDQLQRLPRRLFIKVHQHVAAEDDIKAAAVGRRLNVLRVGRDQVRLLEPHGGA